ncbi:hypothetical protein [Nocardioides convexus]|nr:hypothetical protein [Nocardioides convexus]
MIAVDIADYGYDRALHISNYDGANAHGNDAFEEPRHQRRAARA